MANTIEYGLKFNTEDLDKVLKKISATESKIKDYAKKRYESESKTASFYEKEMVNLKKQSLMMNKKLTKEHLKELETLYKHYYSNIKGLDQKSADDLTKQQLANVKQRQKITSSITNIPLRVAKYLGTSTLLYGGLGALRSGIGSIKEYEKSLSSAYSALGNVTESQKELIRNLTVGQYLVNNYAISSEDAARGINVLAKAGLSASESIKVLEPALQLSAAGDIDLEVATESLVKTINGFGLEMNQAGKITDYFAYSAAKSVTDIKELSDAMRVAAPSAKVFKQDVEDTFSVLSAFAQAGVKSAAAGNAYDRILKRLTKSQKEVKEGLQKYNIKVFLDENGKATEKQTNKLRNLSDIMIDMEKSGLMQNFADAQTILGQYTFKNAAQLSSVVSLLPEYKKGIEEASGAAKEMANIKLDNLAGELQKLEANWKNTFTGKDGIGNTLKDATFSLNEFIQLLNKLTNQGQGRSPLSWYTDIFKNANKEIEKTQRMLGQIQDSTLDFGLGDNAKSQRRVEFLSGLSDKELNDKIKGYKRNISIFAESIKNEEQKLKDSPFFANRTKIKEDKKVLEEQYAYLAYASALERKRRLNIPAIIKPTKTTAPLLDGDNGEKIPKPLKEDWSEYDDYIRNMNQSFEDRQDIYNKIEEYERNKRDNIIVYQKEIDDYRERSLKRQEEVRQKYQGIGGKLSDMQLEMNYEMEMAQNNEELILNIKKDYSEQAMQLYREDWEKRNQIANAALGSMEAGYNSFTQAMSNDLQISKNESEAIWEAMKQSFITKIMEMAWSAALSGIFSFFMNPAKSFLGGFGQKGGLGAALGGGGGGVGGTEGFGAGSIFNAPMGGSAGVTLPTQSMVNGGSSKNDNSALISELRSLRLAVARSDANNIKAIQENTPIVQGTMMDNIKIYKASEIGKRKSNFLVSPT